MEEEPLRYCGFEIWEAADGFDLKQEAYAKELVEKWGAQDKVEAPIFKVPEEEEEVEAGKLWEAQAITGGGWPQRRAQTDGWSGDDGEEYEDSEAGGGHRDDAAEVCERHEWRGAPLHEGVGVDFEREAA